MEETEVIKIDGVPYKVPKGTTPEELDTVLQQMGTNVPEDPAYQAPVGTAQQEAYKIKPQEYMIDPSTIALSGLIGSLAGGAIGKIAKTAGGAALGTLEGGISGTASSGVSELIKEATNNSNVGQLTALGAEILTAGALPLARDVISRVPTAALMASLGYAKAKTAQAVTGESASSKLAKDKIFGTDIMKKGVATTNYREAYDESAAIDMANKLGVSVPAGTKAQDAVRDTLYDSIDNLNNAGIPFEATPAGAKLMMDLRRGYARDGVVKQSDIVSIKKLLKSQTSPDSKTKMKFTNRLLNTAQQSTKEADGVVISERASEMLKEAIDGYIGKPYYKTLKETEKERYTAQAMDDIPVLLSSELGGKNMEQQLMNLAKNPEGVKMFDTALKSYIRGFPEQEALKRWTDLYESGVLKRSGVMKDVDIDRMAFQVKRYVEKGYLRKAGDISGHAMKMSLLTGVLPSELAESATKKPNKNKKVDLFAL